MLYSGLHAAGPAGGTAPAITARPAGWKRRHAGGATFTRSTTSSLRWLAASAHALRKSLTGPPACLWVDRLSTRGEPSSFIRRAGVVETAWHFAGIRWTSSQLFGHINPETRALTLHRPASRVARISDVVSLRTQDSPAFPSLRHFPPLRKVDDAVPAIQRLSTAVDIRDLDIERRAHVPIVDLRSACRGDQERQEIPTREEVEQLYIQVYVTVPRRDVRYHHSVVPCARLGDQCAHRCIHAKTEARVTHGLFGTVVQTHGYRLSASDRSARRAVHIAIFDTGEPDVTVSDTILQLQLRAGELRSRIAREIGLDDVPGSAVHAHPAPIDPDCARTQILHRSHVVRDEQDGPPPAVQAFHGSQTLPLEAGIADGQNFIDDQNIGIQVRRDGESQPEPHARRIALDRRVEK